MKQNSFTLRSEDLMGINPSRVAFWQSTFQDLGTRLHISGSLDRNSIHQIEAAVDAN